MSKNKLKTLKEMDESFVLIRLTALWALSEAGLGGLLHLFRSPFTGLIVGSISVMLISMIAYIASKPHLAILKALVLVLVVKMTISPHSPLPAYFAVAFQGILSSVLFGLLNWFRLSCLMLGILALMESALQKLLTLTIIFGNSIWDSIDLFVEHVSSKFSSTPFEHGSIGLVSMYLGLYAIAGCGAGFLAGVLPAKVERKLPEIPSLNIGETDQMSVRKKRSFWKSKKFKLFVLVIILITLAYFFIPGARQVIDPAWLILRILLVLSVWYFFIGPLLLNALRGFLKKKSGRYQEEVNEAISLIPVFRAASFEIWKNNAGRSFVDRIGSSLVEIIAFGLTYSKKENSND